ncbi:MAG: DUF1015 domain-containing protein [Thermodesulfovibrionales bacterium]
MYNHDKITSIFLRKFTMAEIIPFKGILYNTNRVSIEDVLSPPYDIITHEYREELYRRSPYNIVRIDFGKEFPDDNENENKYTRARRFLDDWLKEGILIRNERPSFYAYGMSYKIDGKEKNLIGLLALVKLEEFNKGKIHPHECTYSKPKQDRLNLLRICEANTSPIFSLYKSSDRGIYSIISKNIIKKPLLEATDSAGAIHRLWQISDETDLEKIKIELSDKDIFIADGHHRYETALEFKKEMRIKKQNISRNEPFNYVMMFLANMLDNGITILPTHRLLKKIPIDTNERLSKNFDIEAVYSDFYIPKILSGRKCTFGFYQNIDDRWYILKCKENSLSKIHPSLRQIDVFVLHDLILKNILDISDIDYEMDTKKTLEKVKSGEYSAAFFLNPTSVEDVEIVASLSVRMPPKSTYFYPKLLTGIVINSFKMNNPIYIR